MTIDGEEITTTPEHPFYVEGKGWVEAKDLQVGDDIRKADGSSGEVEEIEIEKTTREMYNLTVDEAHTFYVGDGQWLVHNACDGIMNPKNIYYMQDTGSDYFKDRRKWIDLAEGLKNGTINPNNIPPIRIYEEKGKLWSLDNRRLAAFEYAGVDIPYVWATADEIENEAWKMTTKTNGTSILINGINIIVSK